MNIRYLKILKLPRNRLGGLNKRYSDLTNAPAAVYSYYVLLEIRRSYLKYCILTESLRQQRSTDSIIIKLTE